MKEDTRQSIGKSKAKKKKGVKMPKHLEHINVMAAGIDIGSRSHFVAVPEGCSEQDVREFGTFTTDLHALAAWLKECGITTVAMESTGVYWIPVYEILEQAGFEVNLVDARQLKNVSGRKTDVLDCQWIQQLHTYGLLKRAFRPTEQICVLRTYLRQRSLLIQEAGITIQRMQKALMQMNVQLHHVLSDITGQTGMTIIRAMVSGDHDPKSLATYRNGRCKRSVADIEAALTGNYRADHLFSLQQAVELYDVYQDKIADCDRAIEAQLKTFSAVLPEEVKGQEKEADGAEPRGRSHCKNQPAFNARAHLIRISGVDLTQVPGLEAHSALKILSEIGLDFNQWKSAKQFASWLGLSPVNKISGGKQLSSRTKRSTNSAAAMLRMAASTLHSSKSSLGAFFRRLKARLGAPKAVTAAAHKLAVIIYNMLKNGVEYREAGQDYYETQYRQRLVKNLKKSAKSLGFELIETADVSVS